MYFLDSLLEVAPSIHRLNTLKAVLTTNKDIYPVEIMFNNNKFVIDLSKEAIESNSQLYKNFIETLADAKDKVKHFKKGDSISIKYYDLIIPDEDVRNLILYID